MLPFRLAAALLVLAAGTLPACGPDARLEALGRAVDAYAGESLAPTSYRVAFGPLEGGGPVTDADPADALVLLEGPRWCGSGGCTLLVFRGTPEGFDLVSSVPLVRAPVFPAEAASNGWRDLLVTVGGGGGPSGTVRLAFGPEGYPPNPSVLPLLESGVPTGEQVDVFAEHVNTFE